MAGSGTVLRQATDLGHQAIGFDMDPLAVLMTRVWTTAVGESLVDDLTDRVTKRIEAIDPVAVKLDWMDNDAETSAFVDYWFAEPQKGDLRRIAFMLDEFGRELTDPAEQLALDLLRIALSRLIITKDKGASLARDVSHNRSLVELCAG